MEIIWSSAKKSGSRFEGPMGLCQGARRCKYLLVFTNTFECKFDLNFKNYSKFLPSNQRCRPPMLTPYYEGPQSGSPSGPPLGSGPPSGFQSADEETELLTMEVLEKHEVNFKKCKTILVVKK